jgi:hypothetical protein
MAAQFPIIKSAGSGLFEPDYIRALIAKAEGGPTVTRTAPRTAAQPAPVRRPLSKAAAAYAAEVQRLADERMARIVKAYAPAAATRPVAKAKDDPAKALVAVYTSDGTLCGVVAQGQITYLAQPPSPKPAASGAAQDAGPRQQAPTQAPQQPQPGPAAAAAADPSQPGALPAGPNQLADEVDQDAVTKMVNSGSLEGVVQLLKQRTLDGSARERREAGQALTALGLAKYAQIRAGGAQRQMKR